MTPDMTAAERIELLDHMMAKLKEMRIQAEETLHIGEDNAESV